jgi:hypothetical protein
VRVGGGGQGTAMALSLQVENHTKAFLVTLNALHRVHVSRAVASRSTDDYSKRYRVHQRMFTSFNFSN